MSLTDKVFTALKNSAFWTDKTRVSGATIQGLTCPACGEKARAWCYAESPMSINCNRGKCGARTRTVELFDIRLNIEKEFPASKKTPHLPAAAYLESRGLKSTLDGLTFAYWPNIRKTGSGGVMFPLGKDAAGKDAWNGRLFNPPPGEGKTHNQGSTTGLFWRHPGRVYDTGKPVLVVEGIIDALSLIELGHQAIAILASGQDPAKLVEGLKEFEALVLAFDPDPAGQRAAKKYKAVFPNAEVVMLDAGQDWNDFLRSGPIAEVREHYEKNIDRYKFNGCLALAESAAAHAEMYRKFHERPPGLFTWGGSTWHGALNYNRSGKGDLTVCRVLQAIVSVRSFLTDRSDPANPITSYHLDLVPPKGRTIEAIATSKDLASLRGLKEFFLARKINYEAGAMAATALAGWVTNAKAPPVQQLSITGYDPESRWYFFKDWAIDPGGKIHLPDSKGLFKVSHNDFRFPAAHAGEKSITPERAGGSTVREIHKLLFDAWGYNGAAAFVWMVVGWFVNQIKDDIGFFPFLSLWGDPSSGKSALATIMNACQGVDGEGLPLGTLNTKKGIARIISRQSGRFTACLEETDRQEQKSFDYSILLTGYNKGPLSIQATFSSDNRVQEKPFLGSLMFVQNSEPFTGTAEKQRVISLHFLTDQLNDTTRAAYEKITKIPLPKLARTIQEILQHRIEFENNWHKEYEQAIADLTNVENRRILQNHSLLLAFHRIFCRLFKIECDLNTFMKALAEQKCITAAVRLPSPADHFFEQLDTIEDDKLAKVVAADEVSKRIFINLPGCEALLRQRALSFVVSDTLTKALIAHPAFIKSGHKYRFPGDELDASGRIRQKKAWVFDLLKLHKE